MVGTVGGARSPVTGRACLGEGFLPAVRRIQTPIERAANKPDDIGGHARLERSTHIITLCAAMHQVPSQVAFCGPIFVNIFSISHCVN